MRNNFAAIRLILAFPHRRKEFNLRTNVAEFYIGRHSVEQFHDKLFVIHEINLAESARVTSAVSAMHPLPVANSRLCVEFSRLRLTGSPPPETAPHQSPPRNPRRPR